MNLSAEARARFGKDDLPLPPDPNFWEVFNKVVGMGESQFQKLRDNQVSPSSLRDNQEAGRGPGCRCRVQHRAPHYK